MKVIIVVCLVAFTAALPQYGEKDYPTVESPKTIGFSQNSQEFHHHPSENLSHQPDEATWGYSDSEQHDSLDIEIGLHHSPLEEVTSHQPQELTRHHEEVLFPIRASIPQQLDDGRQLINNIHQEPEVNQQEGSFNQQSDLSQETQRLQQQPGNHQDTFHQEPESLHQELEGLHQQLDGFQQKSSHQQLNSFSQEPEEIPQVSGNFRQQPESIPHGQHDFHKLSDSFDQRINSNHQQPDHSHQHPTEIQQPNILTTFQQQSENQQHPENFHHQFEGLQQPANFHQQSQPIQQHAEGVHHHPEEHRSEFQYNRVTGRPIAILRDERHNLGNGEFSFTYETENGISETRRGYPGTEGQTNMEGFFSFPLPDGTFAEVRYVADENGFRAESPLIPTPHPLPAHAIEQIRFAEEQRAKGVTFNDY